MQATGLRGLVGRNAVVPSFIFEGSDFVERVLALRLKLLQLFFPVADSIPAVVQRLVQRLAIERGLQFGNRFIERRYLSAEKLRVSGKGFTAGEFALHEGEGFLR
jgi:hypothetical protein